MNNYYLLKTIISSNFHNKKHIFNSGDKKSFEASSFFRKEENRYDLCISSGSGCLNNCQICQCTYIKTGYEKYLTANDIAAQIDFLMQDGKNLCNAKTMVLVNLMGNGDFMQNYQASIKALKTTHQKYPQIFRFGVSTIGIGNPKCILSLAKLSIAYGMVIWMQFSMVSMVEETRTKMLPKAIPLNKILPYLDNYAKITGNKVRYNFPVIEGINDSLEEMKRIIFFVRDNPRFRKIKLSSFNEIKAQSKDFQPAADEKIKYLARHLRDHNIEVDEFYGDRDKKLNASCGQMREKTFDRNWRKDEIVIVSGNPDKIGKIRKTAEDFNVRIKKTIQNSTSESGLTYLDRALTKARAGYKITNCASFAYDCGMEIYSLNNFPGILTKNGMNDQELLNFVLQKVKELSPKKRLCSFVGVGVIALNEDYYLYSRHEDIGQLIDHPRGNIPNGHPLASILYMPKEKRTLAELKYNSKDQRIIKDLFGQFSNII